ncbi:MAG: nucleoside hydrolase [Ilumatobacteraceae bacterium]
MPRPFFIDTDTASDDAVALIIALRHPDVNIVGIGIVAGNVPLEMGIQNALYTAEMCGSSVPIYRGADRPLVRELATAQNVHGNDGMGDIGLPLCGRIPADGNATDALIAAANAYAGELTLVTLGPLTNIADALQRDPTLPKKIARCVVMGAAVDHIGNVTPVAEFNMWCDPHAVEIVLASGMNLEFVGWDISRKYAVVSPAQERAIRAIGTPLAEFSIDIQRVVVEFCANETHIDGFDLPDPIAMAYAINGNIATEVRDLYLTVETQGSYAFGMVVMDTLGVLHQVPNARVVTCADSELFLSMLTDALKV